MSAELEHLTQAWNTAWLEKDAAAVEELMTDGYVYMICVRRDGRWQIALEHCSPNGT